MDRMDVEIYRVIILIIPNVGKLNNPCGEFKNECLEDIC